MLAILYFLEIEIYPAATTIYFRNTHSACPGPGQSAPLSSFYPPLMLTAQHRVDKNPGKTFTQLRLKSGN